MCLYTRISVCINPFPRGYGSKWPVLFSVSYMSLIEEKKNLKKICIPHKLCYKQGLFVYSLKKSSFRCIFVKKLIHPGQNDPSSENLHIDILPHFHPRASKTGFFLSYTNYQHCFTLWKFGPIWRFWMIKKINLF